MGSPSRTATIEGISPEEVAKSIPGSNQLTSGDGNLRGLVLQHFQLVPGQISLPTIRDHLLMIHLQGPVYLEEELDSKLQRCWSDRNRISLTPAGASVTRVLRGRPEVLLIHLSDRLVKEVASTVWDVDPASISLRKCLAEPDEHVSQLGHALLIEVSEPTIASGLMTDLLGRAMALNLLKKYSSVSAPQTLKPIHMARGRLGRVLRHMQENLEEGLSLKDLATLAGVSPSHFARSFRYSMDQSPHQYLIALRIEKARDLLEDTSKTITEIGLTCGFSQPNHFSSAFRKHTGLSPRAWRREFRK